MKFITRFRPTDIVAGILLAFIGMMFTSVANAGECIGDYPKEHSWTPPTQREAVDGVSADLDESEIAGYTIHIGDKKGVYDRKVWVKGGSKKSQVIGMQPNSICYAAITTKDTGGRESGFSKEIIVETGAAVLPVTPAAVSDLTVARNGTSDRDYIASFSDVTVDTDGNPLPHKVKKYFLFQHMADGTTKWLQDVNYSTGVPIVRTYRKGEVTLSLEAEYIRADSSSVVSEKSAPVTFVVDDFVEVEPPVVQPPVIVPPKVIEIYVVKDAPTIIKIIPE